MDFSKKEGQVLLSKMRIIKCEYSHHFQSDYTSGFPNDCFGYILTGRGRFVTETTTLVVDQDDIICVPKGTKYYSDWDGCPQIGFFSLQYQIPKRAYRYKLQTLNNVKEYRKLFFQIYDASLETEKASLSLSYFYRLEYLLGKRLDKSCFQDACIGESLSYLEQNLFSEVPVSILAKSCNLSESYFYAMFKRNTGCTPMEYKNRLKIEKAVEYLRETDYTVETISSLLNFSSPAFFRKMLKRFTGETPSGIRKSG